LDSQVVENIPRETLVTLLKRKDNEAKASAAKLEKLEDRYVKLVRHNKILSEDRKAFEHFCGELLPESAGTFEEAAAQETPVNLDALLRSLTTWRGALENAREDRKVFRQFVELVFPSDTGLEHLFDGEAMGSGAFDELQQRWSELEDLHNQSIASVNAMAREQMMARVGEYEEAVQGRRDAERRAEELQAKVTELHRERAQMLTQKFHGRRGVAEADETGEISSPAVDQQLRELRDALEASERREREARESALRREQDSRGFAEAQQSEVQRLKQEIEKLNEGSERQRNDARKLLAEKDAAIARLSSRLGELEKEAGSNAFIATLAEQQASRDAEVRAKERLVEHLNQTLDEVHRQLQLSYSQERVLKERIRELEGTHSRGHVAGDYLKHVVMKYMEYTQVGDLKAQGLVPVLCTLLSLTPEERRSVENPAIPQPLLLLNQAVGASTSWLRGGGNGVQRPEPTTYLGAD